MKRIFYTTYLMLKLRSMLTFIKFNGAYLWVHTISCKACFWFIPGYPLYLSMKMCVFYCFSFNTTKIALRSVKSKQSWYWGLQNLYFSFPNNIFGAPSMFWYEKYAIYRILIVASRNKLLHKLSLYKNMAYGQTKMPVH